MRTLIAITPCLAALLLLGGCQNPRKEVPGHLEPGSVDEVTQRVGGGPVPGGKEPIQGMGMIPLDTFTPPMVPLVESPEVGFIWFYPAQSHDGRSQREGHYVYTLVREPRWGIDKAMHEGRIDLDSIHDIQIGPDGRPYVRPGGGGRARAAREADSPLDPLSRPWAPNGQTQTRVTVVRPNGDVIASGTAPSGSAIDDKGQPTNQLRSVLEDYRASMQSLQRDQQKSASSGDGSSHARTP